MKLSGITLVIIPFLMAMCSKESGVNWENYGAEISLKEATPVVAILENPADFEGKEVKLAGKVIGVCKGSGCWVEIDDGSGKTIFAKSVEHTVSVPKDCENRSIEVQGKVVIMPPEEEHEEHPGEPDVEEGGHVCPQPTVIVTMDAVKLETVKSGS